MPRRLLFLAALSAAVVLGVWGCQDYNFNPVGSCIIQPGSKQVPLAGISDADILFVVDDSGSMDPKQQALANNFNVFINELTRFSVDRVAHGQNAFDYHIAVTTSSIFRNYTFGTCQTTTQGERCCVAQACTVGNACTSGAASGTCIAGATSGTYCCVTPSVCDQGAAAHTLQCGHFATTYESPLVSGCTTGVASAGAAYPAGNFVAAGSNPKVLHFANLFTNCSVPSPACTPNTACGTSKMCYGGTAPAAVCCDDKTTTLNALIAQFQQNIQVGSCGSGEEQHLEAARLALQKAFAGQQPGVAPGEWPHSVSKVVVAFVADEDDCSNPANPATAIVLSGGPGGDTCVADQNPFGLGVQFPLADYTAFFTGLGHPFGAGFVASATPVPCSFGTCTPNTCDGGGGLVGYSPARRLFGVADGLDQAGDEPVEGSVCAPFGATLVALAGLVVPPQGLELDSVPAAADITLVRIATTATGATRRICTRAATQAEADTHTFGWWFYDCSSSVTPPPVSTSATTCIFIDHTSGDCEANPGETYSAEYLGQLPPGGCTSASPDACVANASCNASNVGAACNHAGVGDGVCDAVAGQCCGSLSCAQAFPTADGGPSDPNGWWCYGPTGGTGTCVCKTP
ncbi:MAG TPA: hypothetical protein VFR85_14390 [Anaeromyxobacteraceae bacterium]|nr:hypothetical protein [Anaeromyxobacteraceae bacterium]